MEKDNDLSLDEKLDKPEKLSKSMVQTTKTKNSSAQNPEIPKADFVKLDVDSITIDIVKVDK